MLTLLPVFLACVPPAADPGDPDLAARGLAWTREHTLVASDAKGRESYGFDNVAGLGDVNNDGYDDVIVGAPTAVVAFVNQGAAYVYLGSAAGVDRATERKLSLFGSDGGVFFGSRVAGAGDVNGDGFDDVILGAPGTSGTEDSSGAAYVYLGSSTGVDLGSRTALTPAAEVANGRFGSWVAGAGDLDGDTYDDVVVSDYDGQAVVYFGSATGLDTANPQRITPTVSSTSAIRSLAGAGDLDQDGFDDLAIGLADRTVHVFMGSSTGVDTTSEVTLPMPVSGTDLSWGSTVAGVGDVNGDTYDDLLVGLWDTVGQIPDHPDRGAGYLYAGSSTGLATTGTRIDFNGQTVPRGFAGTVAAPGDVDDDGYADVLISNYLMYGSASGVDASTQEDVMAGQGRMPTFGAGDVDGDGYRDIIAGLDEQAVVRYYPTEAADTDTDTDTDSDTDTDTDSDADADSDADTDTDADTDADADTDTDSDSSGGDDRVRRCDCATAPTAGWQALWLLPALGLLRRRRR